jgi:hypothetical protein
MKTGTNAALCYTNLSNGFPKSLKSPLPYRRNPANAKEMFPSSSGTLMANTLKNINVLSYSKRPEI